MLEDATETSYQVGEFYSPENEGGLMYNDPLLGLQWPLPVGEVSEKDSKWKRLEEIELAAETAHDGMRRIRSGFCNLVAS